MSYSSHTPFRWKTAVENTAAEVCCMRLSRSCHAHSSATPLGRRDSSSCACVAGCCATVAAAACWTLHHLRGPGCAAPPGASRRRSRLPPCLQQMHARTCSYVHAGFWESRSPQGRMAENIRQGTAADDACYSTYRHAAPAPLGGTPVAADVCGVFRSASDLCTGLGFCGAVMWCEAHRLF